MNIPSLAKWWEEGKSRIKGLTKRYCSSRSHFRSQYRDLLVRLVDLLKSRVDSDVVSCVGPYNSSLAEFIWKLRGGPEFVLG